MGRRVGCGLEALAATATTTVAEEVKVVRAMHLESKTPKPASKKSLRQKSSILESNPPQILCVPPKSKSCSTLAGYTVEILWKSWS